MRLGEPERFLARNVARAGAGNEPLSAPSLEGRGEPRRMVDGNEDLVHDPFGNLLLNLLGRNELAVRTLGGGRARAGGERAEKHHAGGSREKDAERRIQSTVYFFDDHRFSKSGHSCSHRSNPESFMAPTYFTHFHPQKNKKIRFSLRHRPSESALLICYSLCYEIILQSDIIWDCDPKTILIRGFSEED